MGIRRLEKPEWQAFFDHLSKALDAQRAQIEVAGLSLGDQVQAEWLPLYGLVYDPKSELVEIVLEGYDHLIHKPREIYVEDEGGQWVCLEIIDADGMKQIVRLKEPLLLPGPMQR